ncbi:MAG: hypothetical protein M1830_002926 [Pleopsidium flavum]|nr:MAG: hypothetical protein M1830_002926 [Pleopsidium flavum]
MRIFLLPISTRRTFIYCQRLNQQISNEQTYIDKLTDRASKLWVKWEKYEKGWQKKVTVYGDKVFQRIPYEEWGLKSIPPLSARRRAAELEGMGKVDVTFPQTLVKPESLTEVLRKLATERQALHTKRMWWSIVGMPISAPVALIPVVPNLPFFYLVFRAWSHWRALSGSKHIEFLLDNKLVRQSPSSVLDTLYALAGVDAALESVEEDLGLLRTHQSQAVEDAGINLDRTQERMLLSKANSKLIAETLEVPELEAELARAVRQVEQSLSAKKDLQEEKSEMEAATKESKTVSKV